MYKILVVDDEEKIRSLICKYIRHEGHMADETGDGASAIRMCKEKAYDLVILDIMMPGLNGFETCKEIKKNNNVAIIMLSAKGEENDKVRGFELGVDDYVVKPFSPKELMMRISAVLRRAKCEPRKESIVANVENFEGLSIDFTARTVSSDGKRLVMTPKEYDLLFYLVKNKNCALTREKLITDVWGYDYYGDDRTLDTHIKLLRKSLGKYSKFIITLRRVGYRFDAF